MSYSDNGFYPVALYMGPSFILYALLAWAAHRAPYAAYTMKALVVEFAVWNSYHVIQELPHITLRPVDDR